MRAYIIHNNADEGYLESKYLDTELDFKTLRRILNREKKAYNEAECENLKLGELLDYIDQGLEVDINGLTFKGIE